MASLERTAYPRFSRVFTSRELHSDYTPTAKEILSARLQVRPNASLLMRMKGHLAFDLECGNRISKQPRGFSVLTGGSKGPYRQEVRISDIVWIAYGPNGS